MSLENIRAQTAAIAAGVDGIGVVHEYERWAADWNKMLALFKVEDDDGSRINGLMITRKTTARRKVNVGEIELAHVLVLRMVMGLKDAAATELTFQALVDALADAFDDNDNETLNDTCDTIRPDWGPMEGAVGLQIDIVEPRMFGSVLCHFFEGRLCALETKED